jgi:hypothetical protein
MSYCNIRISVSPEMPDSDYRNACVPLRRTHDNPQAQARRRCMEQHPSNCGSPCVDRAVCRQSRMDFYNSHAFTRGALTFLGLFVLSLSIYGLVSLAFHWGALLLGWWISWPPCIALGVFSVTSPCVVWLMAELRHAVYGADAAWKEGA